MRNYPLYDLSYTEFEGLVTLICERILGTGTINFSPGKDGGRDAIFTGKANRFPSESKPWEGKFVIQAKHTGKVDASCSDSDFKSILKEEVNLKIHKLQDNGKIDYYLVFANRKLSGNQEAKLSDFIETNLKIDSRIFGNERIQLWLAEYPEIAKVLNLNRLFLPLQFYEKDIKEVIVAFSNQPNDLTVKPMQKLQYTNIDEKNRLNELSADYFKFMQSHSLSFFDKIESFLKDPGNNKYKKMYEQTVSDLQAKIIVKRLDFRMFDELFEEIYDHIFLNNHNTLKDSRNLIRIFLHYMYFKCDIGRSE